MTRNHLPTTDNEEIQLERIKKIKNMDGKFKAGINIAIKIPKVKYEKTVAFYRDILKLEVTL